LTLDQIRGSARAHRDRRLAVSLQAERYSVLAGPVGADGDEVVLDQLGQGAAHVETELLRTGPGDLQQVQRWQRVVPAAALELRREARGPVRLVHFEAVAEHGADELRRHGPQQRLPDDLEMPPGRRCREMVQNGALGSGTGSFDLLPGHPGPG